MMPPLLHPDFRQRIDFGPKILHRRMGYCAFVLTRDSVVLVGGFARDGPLHWHCKVGLAELEGDLRYASRVTLET